VYILDRKSIHKAQDNTLNNPPNGALSNNATSSIPMKIQSKLILAFLALSIPLLVVTNIIFYSSEKKALSHNILNHLESVASIQQNRIHDIAQQNAERLKLVASRTQLRLSLERFLSSSDQQHQDKMNKILRDAKESILDFKHISVYSPDGVIVASSDSSRHENEHLHGDSFAKGKEGNKVDLFSLDTDQSLSLHLAGPLCLENKFLGVILIDTKVDSMVNAISDYTGLGQTGETVLAAKNTNGDTVFIMPTRFDSQAALRLIIPKDDPHIPINRSFSGKGELLTNATDYRKIPVLAATRHIEEFDWGVVVKIDKEETLAPLVRMKMLLFSILAGAISLIVCLSFYLAKNITRPIIRLTGVAHNIADENFEVQAEESQKDEIGMLAAAFNKMTGKLINTRKILEENVDNLQIANRHLLEGEERYREIYNAPSDAIFIHDAVTGKILDVNQGMLDMFGYTYEEALLVDVGSLSSGEPPFTIEEAGSRVHNAVLHGPQSFEWLCRKKDGTFFWGHVALKYTEFSGQRYVIAVTRDINDRKQAQESLYFTKSAIDRSTDSAFWSRQDGNFFYVNDAACKSLGYSREELMAMTVSDFAPDFPPAAWAGHWQDLKEKGSIHVETFHKTKAGKLFPVEVMATFMEYEGKEYNCSFVRDITERKQAEKKLAAEKERLAVTLRSIGDGVITTDIFGNIVLLNKITENLTGWTNEEAVGRPLAEVFNIINEQTRSACENPVTKVINSGQIVELANHTLLVAKDGTERSIADSGAPILDSESNVVGVVLVFRDVTEQARTEKELLKVKKLESIGILAGGIAHDFNNILTAILGNINLALFDTDLKDDTKKLLSEAEKASIRAKDLTQQLLTFAKGGEPVKEVASLDTVIRDSANFVLHGDKVACRFDIPDNLRLVDIDKGQISQVIQNIVLNASHAMPEGGIITVTCENVSSIETPNTSTLPKGLFVKIYIRDEGIGMSANIVEKIFDPYFSTKQEGSGLGLAITHSIIIKHGGHISVESSPGVGTTFTLYLPASGHESEKSQKSKAPIKPSAQANILIMDDDEMVRDIAKAMLTRLGHNVILAAEGVEAVKLYQDSMGSDNIDLVIMDLTIPGGMGGEKAVREVLNIDPNAKIIVSSGYSNDPVMANYRDYGFCSAIVKPYQLKELSKVISQVIA